jgi:hypothetical protein
MLNRFPRILSVDILLSVCFLLLVLLVMVFV